MRVGREALLKRRITERESLGEDFKYRLAVISTKLRRMRMRSQAELKRRLASEACIAWGARRSTELSKLRMLMAGSGRGPKQRHYWRAFGFAPGGHWVG